MVKKPAWIMHLEWPCFGVVDTPTGVYQVYLDQGVLKVLLGQDGPEEDE